ncbi:MAG TPA: hypothetical protein PLD88_13445 [Candidatus Berkiella sp.]|nr:hypothetical protein [Candidatus Berkiella sp.]
MYLVVNPGGTLCGETNLPGDKSISHRALILGALAQGLTIIEGFLASEDCLATLNICVCWAFISRNKSLR